MLSGKWWPLYFGLDVLNNAIHVGDNMGTSCGESTMKT